MRDKGQSESSKGQRCRTLNVQLRYFRLSSESRMKIFELENVSEKFHFREYITGHLMEGNLISSVSSLTLLLYCNTLWPVDLRVPTTDLFNTAFKAFKLLLI